MALSFTDLMNAASNEVPVPKKAPDGMYRLTLENGKIEMTDKGQVIRFVFKAIENINDPSDDVSMYEAEFASWGETAPEPAVKELATLIGSLNLPAGGNVMDVLADCFASKEYTGKVFLGTVSTNGKYRNLRGLRMEA